MCDIVGPGASFRRPSGYKAPSRIISGAMGTATLAQHVPTCNPTGMKVVTRESNGLAGSRVPGRHSGAGYKTVFVRKTPLQMLRAAVRTISQPQLRKHYEGLARQRAPPRNHTQTQTNTRHPCRNTDPETGRRPTCENDRSSGTLGLGLHNKASGPEVVDSLTPNGYFLPQNPLERAGAFASHHFQCVLR